MCNTISISDTTRLYSERTRLRGIQTKNAEKNKNTWDKPNASIHCLHLQHMQIHSQHMHRKLELKYSKKSKGKRTSAAAATIATSALLLEEIGQFLREEKGTRSIET